MDPSFPSGVASFDPSQTAVLLWTRAPDAPMPVRWWISDDPSGHPAREGWVAVPDDAEGCVTVEVDDLEPGRTWWYGFESDGVPSPVGRTRTLPGEGAQRFRIAVVSCADVSTGGFAVYRSVAEADVDLVLHLGDAIYEEPKGDTRSAGPDGIVNELWEYRARHAETRDDPDLRALHQRHPMVAVWDDHDVADNAWRHGAKAHDPERDGPWQPRLDAAVQAWHEWMPSRRRSEDPLVIWRSLEVGDLAELVLMDARIAGRDGPPQRDDSPELHDPDRSLLGDEQRTWVHDRVADGTRPWCLLASSVVVNPMTLPLPSDVTDLDAAPSGYAVVDGEALCTDEWDGYPAERDRLVEAIGRRDRGAVVVLSADVHSSWAFEGPADAEGRAVAVELTASAVTSAPMGSQLPSPLEEVAEGRVDGHVERMASSGTRWSDLWSNGYLVVDVLPRRVEGHFFAVDPEDAEARTVPLSSWEVDVDRPGHLEPTVDDRRHAGTGATAEHVPGSPPVRGGTGVGDRRRRLAGLAGAGLAVGGAVAAGVVLRRWWGPALAAGRPGNR